MRKIVIAVIVIGIIAGGYFFWMKKNAGPSAAGAEKKTAAVERGTIIRNVQATGLVASKLDVEIKCKASGEIVSLPFDVSAKVKKGDLLLELDPTDEDRNVKKAQVALIQAQARLDQTASDLGTTGQDLTNSKQSAKVTLNTAKIKALDAKTKEERVKQLYDKKLVSKEEYDTAHTAAVQAQADYEQTLLKIDQLKTETQSLEVKRQSLKIAKADVESARINLSIVEQRLKETKVYSPTDGTITALNAQTGQIISSGINNVGGGTSIMTVSDISQLYVLASIDESDIGEIQEGQRVIITADAYPKQRFRGVVDRIAQKGLNQSNVVTFEVRIEVTSENKDLLKPEMTANVEIVIEKKDDVLIVPAGAVFNEDQKQAEEAAASGKGGKGGAPGEAASSTVGGGRAVSAGRAAGGGASGSVSGEGRKRRRGGGAGGFNGAAGMGGGMPKLKQYVTVITGSGDDLKTEVREVQTGMTDGENVEIISGLKEGEMVETREDVVSSKWNGGGGRGPRGPMGMMH